ncbi:EAL domain-containing protein [Thalassoglobus sp. JC818]|uniref:EAL domain-containing protein n=1 Tax=Thalassoglobus sp. JC818 TaxID=3232136 RepID=UPI00345A31E4
MSVQAITPKKQQSAPTSGFAGWSLIGCVPPSTSLTETPIETASFVIGRRAESQLRLKSQCVSGRHAEILQIGESLFIRDLDSTNGTFLNRRMVSGPIPIKPGDHIQIADVEFRVDFKKPEPDSAEKNLLEQKKTLPAVHALQSDWVMSQLEDLIVQKAIIPHYQPIVALGDVKIVGYEALARSEVVGLESPARMFQTAEIVNREVALSIVCRDQAIRHAPHAEPCPPIFVNTHPNENIEVDVLPTISRLQKIRSDVPIVVEFHEKTIQSPSIMRENRAMLADIGVKVAYDDFGAGQSRLIELVQSPPDYLKFDASLIRDLHEANDYQKKMLRILIETARDFGIVTLAEGIENEQEAEAVFEIGFDLAQGYFYGRPAPVQL